MNVGEFWQFEPGIHINIPGIFQLKSKIRPIFAHFDRKSSVFGTIITFMTDNVTDYAIVTYKNTIKKVEIQFKTGLFSLLGKSQAKK